MNPPRPNHEEEERASSEEEGIDVIVQLMEEEAPAAAPRQEEQEPRETHRCDLSRGLVRIDAGAMALDPEVDAIPFMVAFEMQEFTTLPRLLLDLLWVLNNIRGVTEKGEKGAFVARLPGLRVVSRSGGKSIIYRVTRQANGEEEREQMPELNLQIRIYEVSAPCQHGGAATTTKERFATVVALSPLAFSLRHAAYITTRSIGRVTQGDAHGADERRRVWSQVAMHVRSVLRPYQAPADLLEYYESSMDWMLSAGPDNFTCLFSMQRAFDWMKAKFIAKHRPSRDADVWFTEPVRVHGVRRRMRPPPACMMRRMDGQEEEEEDFGMDVQFCEECAAMDDDVDREIARSNNNNGTNALKMQ